MSGKSLSHESVCKQCSDVALRWITYELDWKNRAAILLAQPKNVLQSWDRAAWWERWGSKTGTFFLYDERFAVMRSCCMMRKMGLQNGHVFSLWWRGWWCQWWRWWWFQLFLLRYRMKYLYELKLQELDCCSMKWLHDLILVCWRFKRNEEVSLIMHTWFPWTSPCSFYFWHRFSIWQSPKAWFLHGNNSRTCSLFLEFFLRLPTSTCFHFRAWWSQRLHSKLEPRRLEWQKRSSLNWASQMLQHLVSMLSLLRTIPVHPMKRNLGMQLNQSWKDLSHLLRW